VPKVASSYPRASLSPRDSHWRPSLTALREKVVNDSRAAGEIANDTDEEGCETFAIGGCGDKFAKSIFKAQSKGGCPVCLQDFGGIRNATADLLDANTGAVYCASPSGAFVDGGLTY
jgi:hypothetical protein